MSNDEFGKKILINNPKKRSNLIGLGLWDKYYLIGRQSWKNNL